MFKTWEDIRRAIDGGSEFLESKVLKYYIKKKTKHKKNVKRKSGK